MFSEESECDAPSWSCQEGPEPDPDLLSGEGCKEPQATEFWAGQRLALHQRCWAQA